MGRPSLGDQARGNVFTLRLSDAERAAIDAAADRARLPVTQWARAALLGAAGPAERLHPVDKLLT